MNRVFIVDTLLGEFDPNDRRDCRGRDGCVRARTDDATTGATNADEVTAELPVTSDVFEEDLVDELADDRTGMPVDDGVATADLATDVSVEEVAWSPS